jgi:hypothetical protein
MGRDWYCVFAMRTSLGPWLPNVPGGLLDGCREESDLWVGLLHSEHDSADVWVASRFPRFAFFSQPSPRRSNLNANSRITRLRAVLAA